MIITNTAIDCIRFPYCGKITRTTNRGFGFVIGPTGSQMMLHIKNHVRCRLTTMEGLEGQYCVYVIGGSPYEYANKRTDWEHSVVQWALLDTYKSGPEAVVESHLKKRKHELQNLDDVSFKTALAADWYKKLWPDNNPKSVLIADTLLEELLQSRLASVESFEELIFLLGVILVSPWYCVNDADRARVCQQFLKSPFRAIKVTKPLESCQGYSDVWPYCGELLNEFYRKARTVAIDLESDKKTIFQFGWKNAAGSELRSNPDRSALSREQLVEAVSSCFSGQHFPCIIGQNLLSWDWPILQQFELQLPDTYSMWDTLLASWLLEPWNSSHALIVKEKAHQADADSEACYELFERQIKKFAPCVAVIDNDLSTLVDKLLEEQSLLAKVQGRDYPDDLYDKTSNPRIYPSRLIANVAWQKHCRLELVAPENRLTNPTLSPEICRRVAVERGDLFVKAVAVIVVDAAANDVEVRLESLPPWLIDANLKSLLQNAHSDQPQTELSAKSRIIYLAEDLFKLSLTELTSRFSGAQLAMANYSEVLTAWQIAYGKKLTEEEVHRTYPSATKSWTRALIPVTQQDGTVSWLLHEPTVSGRNSAAWTLLPSSPSWLSSATRTGPENLDIGRWVRLPQWKDGNVAALKASRLFVSPDTANRPIYLSDVTHSILNLQHAQDNVLLLVALRSKDEAAQMQRNLGRLHRSARHSDSPLRHVEYVRKYGFRVLVCSQKNLSRYVKAAARLGAEIQVVIDEVPLHEWHALLTPPEIDSAISFRETVTVTSDDNDDESDMDLGDNQPGSSVSGQLPPLSGKDIRESVSAFLLEWLQGLLNSDEVPDRPVMILDSRLTAANTARSTYLPLLEIPFFTLEELLDAPTLEVFYEVCYPPRNETSIPIDYETYRRFLQENWHFADFKAGTQKPVIEKLIQTDRDILVRLPTGAGKSVLFHLPALLRSTYSGRLTLVITPLRALMRDQAEGLWQKGFSESVDYLSGGRDAWLNHEVYQGILDGRLKLVFVAPERFRLSQFAEALERRRRMDGGLEFIVFDEAHCISEWGFEFRPDYLFAAEYIAEWFKTKELPGNPHRLLLTSATVTQRNRADLEHELGLGAIAPYEDLPEEMPHPIQPYIVLESCNLEEGEEAAVDQKFDKIIEILSGLDLKQSAALIFVRRKKDCHWLSEALNDYASHADQPLDIVALPFHAGLPETVKGEACELLRERKVNLLVCTKAFGMGMDIPHLHTCIHYTPPAFIEDYLQEVGRIGRDEKERESSGHDLVTATLLYNQENIERNLGLLHEKSVKPPDLLDFYGFCQGKAVPFEGIGRSICIVPAKVRLNETKEFDENQVTNCLFWLERMQVLKIEGRHPPFLDLGLDVNKLHILENGSTIPSRVATVLLSIIDESQKAVSGLAVPAPQPASDSGPLTVFGRLIKGLVSGVLALIAPQTQPPEKLESSSPTISNPTVLPNGKLDITVSMNQLLSACDDLSPDDLFAGLYELYKAEALTIHKSFVVRRSGVPTSENEYRALLAETIERLLRPTPGRVVRLPRKQFEDDLKEWYRDALAQQHEEADETTGASLVASTLTTRRIQREVYRAIITSLRIMRYAGLEVRESLSSDGIAQYVWSVPASERSGVKRSADESIEAMRTLHACISAVYESQPSQMKGGTFEIPLTTMMDALGPEVPVSKLKELMKLVECSGFYGFEGSGNDWVSIVTFDHKMSLEPYNVDSGSGSLLQTVYAEMVSKNELQLLRAQSMVLLTVMPSENRKQFIDRYFECMDARELRKLLEDTVGEVDDEVLAGNPMLQELLVQVRQESFTEEMDKLNENQRAVCVAPYQTNLLVNAGPGSGKTHVLMMRCAHLIHVQHINPSEILVLAFNRAVVYEIRDRIRNLFKTLGYGRYASRLDVSTFHSFALRHQQTEDLYEEDAIEQAVHRFAEKISNEEFASGIAGRYKAILVDEFQDMNEDFFTVIKSLITHCSGGGMVIGDDDQDILTWNRRKWRSKYRIKCELEAVYYFQKFRELFTPDEYGLTHNYRSLAEVVERANGMIQKVSDTVQFQRMKSNACFTVNRVGERGIVDIGPLPEQRYISVVREALDRNDKVAVLCRSNIECRLIYKQLRDSGIVKPDNIDLLGAQDFPLYQLRYYGAMLDICKRRKDYEFIDNFLWNELVADYELLLHADKSYGVECLVNLYNLVREEVGRPRIRDIQNFILEMRASDIKRLSAKFDGSKKIGNIILSTVHKVKGLEYDTVVVMPSSEGFPFQENNYEKRAPEKADFAEEARLYYVAMTRARNRVYLGWGDREKMWWSNGRTIVSRHIESRSFHLKGSPKEVFVSWPGRKDQVGNGLQDYIEKHICQGDKLILRDVNKIVHGTTEVAHLSDFAAKNIKPDKISPFRVANVIRYSCGRYFKERNQNYWEPLDSNVKQQGWFYTVLVEEV